MTLAVTKRGESNPSARGHDGRAGDVAALLVAAALSALLMAVAIRCRSFKEAQANATVILLAVSLLPLVSLFNQEGEQAWYLWVPALAQSALMGRVLEGSPLPALDLLIPVLASAAVATLSLLYVARSLRRAALR